MAHGKWGHFALRCYVTVKCTQDFQNLMCKQRIYNIIDCIMLIGCWNNNTGCVRLTNQSQRMPIQLGSFSAFTSPKFRHLLESVTPASNSQQTTTQSNLRLWKICIWPQELLKAYSSQVLFFLNYFSCILWFLSFQIKA